MLPDKGSIGNYPFVDLVIDADGFGGSYSKISDYNQYANEPPAAKYLGMKLFAYGRAEYNDPDLLSPGGVMSLSPQPSVIIYQ
jgi:hypothetical protein